MTLPIYPGARLLRGLKYSSKWTPQFFNQTVTTATGADLDIGLAQYPLHDFELEYEFLRDGVGWGDALSAMEFRTLMGFHLQLGGTRGRFLFRNPDDYCVFRNQIAVGDGTTQVFVLNRTFGANGYGASEPVGQVDTAAAFNVYLGTSATPISPTLYSVDTTNPVANTITFTSAPSAAQAISVDMSYYYYCKLAGNSQDFEKFMARIWSAGRVLLHSCRPGA